MNRIGQWRRFVGGVAAALVLLPVPAMAALTFNGTWTVASSSRSGSPTPPAATFTDSTNNAKQEDDLYVDMGNYQGVNDNAASMIELTRGISLSSSHQLLEYEQQFTSQFQQAGVSTTVSVKNANGQVVQTPISFNYNSSGSKLATLNVSQATVNNQLTAGNYTLDVKVTYGTNNKVGLWKNISKHHFEFLGE